MLDSIVEANDRIEALEETVERLKADHATQLDRMSTAQRSRDLQRNIAEMQVRNLTKLAQRQRGTIGEVNQATREDAYYQFTVENAFRIARLMGFYSEVNTFADELGLTEMWDRVYNDSTYNRVDDSNDLYSKVYAIVRSQQDYPHNDRHPMEAQFTDLWREAYKIARQHGMCDTYETVAGYLGIPTEYDLSWSGTVRVYVEGWFEFDTSGTSSDGSPDASEEMYDVDLSKYADSLEMTAEWSELIFGDED